MFGREQGQLSVSSDSRILARDVEWDQNYPNSFNPTTRIAYRLPFRAEVKLVVFDMIGREVATLVNQRQEAGQYEATFHAGSLSSGSSFYTLQVGGYSETKKRLLIK